MYVIKLKKADNTISLRNVRQSITLQQTGRRGPQGEPGEPGEGVPIGGTIGQVLTKQSNVDFDTDWEAVPSAPVTSVNGETGVVLLDKSDIGLANVDNTSDANKPISTATQTALNDKYDASNPDSFVDAAGAALASPVHSVNSQTGVVVLTGENIRIVAASPTTIADGIASLITNKLERSGGTMTGSLSIDVSTGDVLSLNGTGSNNTILRLRDDGTERGAIFSLNGSSVLNFRSQGDLVLIARNSTSARSITINDLSATLSAGLDLQVDSSANGLVLRSPNNTRWRVQVTNAGALTVTSI